MNNEEEKLEIKKKPQQVNKEELDKVAGGKSKDCKSSFKSFCA